MEAQPLKLEKIASAAKIMMRFLQFSELVGVGWLGKIAKQPTRSFDFESREIAVPKMADHSVRLPHETSSSKARGHRQWHLRSAR
jgi:hypothetical protein